MTSRALKLAFVLAITIILAGCGGTVKSFLKSPEFQAENQPVRELRLAVYSDGMHSGETIRERIAEASESFEEQVGIRLKIVSFQPITWEGLSPAERLDKLDEVSWDSRDKFDLAIAFAWHSATDLAMICIFGSWLGVTDDTYRRFIVIKTATQYVIMHEIGHTFIFSHGHSSTGLMQGLLIKILPGVPAFNETIYLSPEDRKEILKNKWRNFNKKPPLKEEDRQDLLKEDIKTPAK